MVEFYILRLQLIQYHKATFNKHTSKYELRQITDNTDWSKPSLSPTITELQNWTKYLGVKFDNKLNFD